MAVDKIAHRLVDLCKQGDPDRAVAELYADNIVSIEAQGSAEMPARMEGIAAVKGKGEWWNAHHQVHSMTAVGPFVGHRDDQFVVQFDLDVTPKATGERMQMSEVGIYTVKNDKIVQEEFLYLSG